MNRKTAIVLGGTNPHIELIRQLKKRSFYVILIDYLDDPPAKQFADLHVQESTLDIEAVLSITTQYRADLVISTCIDHANSTAAYVGEKLGLPVPYSYETALLVTDKEKMKQAMIGHGIPTSKYFVTSKAIAVEEMSLNWPVVVKPVDSNSSKGVRVAHIASEFDVFFAEAQKLSRSGNVIVEEFAKGQEISIDCYVSNGQAHIIMLRKKFNGSSNGGKVIHNFGSISPTKVSPEQYQKMQLIANQVVECFKFNNTSLLIQVLMDDDDINVIEFGARVGGGMSYRTVKMVTGFDLISATISSFLGETVEVEIGDSTHYYLAVHLFAEQCILGEITGMDELLSQGLISDCRINKRSGTIINADRSSSERVCGFIILAESILDAKERLVRVVNHIDIIDTNGNSVIVRDDLLNSFLLGLDELSPVV